MLRATDFDEDDEEWYVKHCAHEQGADPTETWHRVLAARRTRSAILETAISAPNATAESPSELVHSNSGSLSWPPGRAGNIAKFIFESSYTPIKEVAIVGALGLLAGVCGRAYRTHTGKDLALYQILVAKSGVGKDGIHEGIPRMLELSEQPLASYFLRAEDFVSGEALHKAMLRTPGFLSLQGEFGRKLKRMANPTDAPMQTFRTTLTNAFAKQSLEGKTYSHAADDVAGVDWPALSFLGETTPSTFHESLTSDMMQDGFLSRFLVTTYDGGQPAPNRDRYLAAISEPDLQHWKDLVAHTSKYTTTVFMPDAITASPSSAAKQMLIEFEDSCREKLNATEHDAERHVWTRAHLKAMKVAGLLAVSDNYLAPKVCEEHVSWAIGLVRRDISLFIDKQRNGDIGTGDSVRIRKILVILRKYIHSGSPPSSYKVPPAMQENGVVTRSYLSMRTSNVSGFSDHKNGANRALADTVCELVENGYLHEIRHDKVAADYNHHGKAYRILRLD